MAASKLTLPNIGDFSEVDVIEVNIQPGDSVTPEQPLITLETDKAAMEIPAPHAGVIKEVLVKVGDKISEGDVYAVLEASESGQATETNPPATSAPVADTQATEVPSPVAAETSPEPATRMAPAPPPDKNAYKTARGMPHAGPAVRKLARKLGVDLFQVEGSGPHDRILKEDVEAFVKRSLQDRGSGLAVAPLPSIDFSQFGDIETRELSKIQRLTGQNTHRAWVSIPHVTQFDEADITELEAFRKEEKSEYESRNIKLTLLPFVVKAVVSALRAFPRVNSSLNPGGESLTLKKYFHIGIAVDTPHGLVVPVLRNADCKGVAQLACEIADLAERARNKRLKPEELQGGCFTITSLGHISGTAFTPIINEPEVAILGLSKARLSPVYRGETLVPRLILPLSLSYDHRVIDGVLAAKFTQHLAETLADARKMLL